MNYLTDTNLHSSMHMRALNYDPMHTDNLLVIDYYNHHKLNNDDNTLSYIRLIDEELKLCKSIKTKNVPTSFKLLWYLINFDWILIINQMLFIDKAYETFYAEYRDTIDNILRCKSVNIKDYLIYRSYINGESAFHSAAKIRLFNTHMNHPFDIPILTNEYENIINAYYYLGICVNNDKHSIINITDWNGITLNDYINNFKNDLISLNYIRNELNGDQI